MGLVDFFKALEGAPPPPIRSHSVYNEVKSARVRRSPPESTGVHRSPPESTGVHWSPLESARIHQNPVESAGLRRTPFVTFCDILDSAGLRRSPAKLTGVRRSPPDHVGQCKVLYREQPYSYDYLIEFRCF